ncbi:MAG TPA: SLC13 family permease [Xanthomonadales bacterium]|nr:SLC13 family permease [Xanthomonadales bacterium]
MDAGLTLSTEMMLVLGLIAFTVVMFAFELIRADVVALLLLVVLGLTNLVPVEQIFSGFAGDAVIAILATMILGAGLDRTGVLNFAASFLVRVSHGLERRLLLSLCALAGGLSAFMQNPAITALFLPVAARISSRTGVPMSRLLLPMACCIVLGGTMTMVGNSPQIMLNDLVASMNRNLPPGADTIEPFRMFSVLPVGAALLVAGLAYFGIWWDKLMPPRDERASVTPAKTETYFASTYRIDGEVYELAVTPDSPLVGLSIAELEAQASTPLVLAIKTGEESRLAPPGDQMIWVGTVLGVLGPREDVLAWAEITGLRLQPGLRNFGDMFNATRAGVAEAVVPPNSRYIGKRIGELRLRKNHGVSVLAVNRGDKIFREDVREVVIAQGDTLVFHGFWKDLSHAAGERDFVVVTDYPKEEQRPHKIWHATFFFALAIGLALFSDVKVPVAMLVGATGMLLTGVLSMDEAYAAIGWRTIFLMACLIPLGWAVDSSGAAAWIARVALDALEGVPIWGLEIALAILTSFFTQVMSNVGATVVMVPLAINIALAANANPAVFAMIVVFSASNAFLSMSNPVMSLVSGAGGYRTADLLRVGLPLTLLYTVIVVVMVNLVFQG